MSDLFDLGDIPTLVLVVPLLIGLLFVALPVGLVVRVLRDRTRRRTWTPTTARLLATRDETRSTGDDGHRRTVTVGRWEYRATDGTTHTGEGDLDGVWVDAAGERELEVLVDPADPSRSVARTAAPGAALVVVLAVALAFGVIGVVLLGAVLAAFTA